jgi:ribonuclease VapC
VFLEKIRDAPAVAVGAPTLVEAAVVLAGRRGGSRVAQLAGFLERATVVVIPFGVDHWRVAGEAWLRFGKGRHPAALNLGDCFAYATARVAGRPLLCKGEDFSKTDLAVA